MKQDRTVIFCPGQSNLEGYIKASKLPLGVGVRKRIGNGPIGIRGGSKTFPCNIFYTVLIFEPGECITYLKQITIYKVIFTYIHHTIYSKLFESKFQHRQYDRGPPSWCHFQVVLLNPGRAHKTTGQASW